MKSYKGLNEDLKCCGFQYETVKHREIVEVRYESF